MPDFDFVVVGAGPAGSTAACTLAESGARVLLIEKHRIPRHKTCGGGMPMVIADSAPAFDRGAIVEAEVSSVRHTWGFTDAIEASLSHPDSARPIRLWMTQRSRFDEALAVSAIAAGAELRDGVQVTAVDARKDGVTVRTRSDGSMTARAVIGADGATGICAHSVGLQARRSIAIALEAEVPFDWAHGHESLRSDTMHLEYGAAQGGYAWVFPKGDHLNVGAGVFRARPDGRGDPAIPGQLRGVVVAYLQSLGVRFDASALQFHAHPLPLWSGRRALASRERRVLLVGDAASLVNPFFGDGIMNAIRSGRIAAEALIDDAPDSYTGRIHRTLGPSLDAAARISRFFYQWPAFSYRHGVCRPTTTYTCGRLLCGDVSFEEVARRALARLRAVLLTHGSVGSKG